jgi:hypothetical protein
MTASWRDKPPEVTYLSVLDGSELPKPQLPKPKPKPAKRVPGTNPGGRIGEYGPCVACGSATFARFGSKWCHIGCRDDEPA